MYEEIETWTFTADRGKNYSVAKFTEEGRKAFAYILQINDRVREAQKEITRLNKQIDIDDEALRLVNGIVSQQLTDAMLIKESKNNAL